MCVTIQCRLILLASASAADHCGFSAAAWPLSATTPLPVLPVSLSGLTLTLTLLLLPPPPPLPLQIQRSRLAFVSDDTLTLNMHALWQQQGDGSVHGGASSMDVSVSARAGTAVALLCEGDAVGELAFFTDTPSPEAAYCESVCRTLVLSKSVGSRALLGHVAMRVQHNLRVPCSAGHDACGMRVNSLWRTNRRSWMA